MLLLLGILLLVFGGASVLCGMMLARFAPTNPVAALSQLMAGLILAGIAVLLLGLLCVLAHLALVRILNQ